MYIIGILGILLMYSVFSIYDIKTIFVLIYYIIYCLLFFQEGFIVKVRVKIDAFSLIIITYTIYIYI